MEISNTEVEIETEMSIGIKYTWVKGSIVIWLWEGTSTNVAVCLRGMQWMALKVLVMNVGPAQFCPPRGASCTNGNSE